MRKIIQIQTNYTGMYTQFTALCDDGTVWFKTSFNAKWKQLDTVPQPEKPEPIPNFVNKPNTLNTYDGLDKSTLGSTLAKTATLVFNSANHYLEFEKDKNELFNKQYTNGYQLFIKTINGQFYERIVISKVPLSKDDLINLVTSGLPNSAWNIEFLLMSGSYKE